MTGITRRNAAAIVANYFGTASYTGEYAYDREGRKWNFVYDSSITAQRKLDGRKISASSDYRTELVSPICRYEDIEDIQEIVRLLRNAGAFTNDSTGIHVHIDASAHNAKTLRNLTNIMRSKEDILYKALQVEVARENRYCKKVDEDFLNELNRKKPTSREELQRIWYNGYDGSSNHYHQSRYKALNLHSVFQKGTVEFRLFNGTMHAGKIKTYIQLALAISHQALTQKSARPTRMTSSNEKYTFRTWLLRLGLIGKEFETARYHLLKNLDGNIAWKNPEDAEKQKLARRHQEESLNVNEGTNNIELPEAVEQEPPGTDISMSM